MIHKLFAKIAPLKQNAYPFSDHFVRKTTPLRTVHTRSQLRGVPPRPRENPRLYSASSCVGFMAYNSL